MDELWRAFSPKMQGNMKPHTFLIHHCGPHVHHSPKNFKLTLKGPFHSEKLEAFFSLAQALHACSLTNSNLHMSS